MRSHAPGGPPRLETQDLPPRATHRPILRAIVECELHERIFQGTWRVVPAFAGQGADAGN